VEVSAKLPTLKGNNHREELVCTVSADKSPSEKDRSEEDQEPDIKPQKEKKKD
jgi:hypothetical protein